MKKSLLIGFALGFTTFSSTVLAQDKKLKEKPSSQEIIIRKKGDKDSKFTVEINGDKVTINGKPLADFKDDNITINRRMITVWDKNGMKAFEMNPGEFMNGFKMFNDSKGDPYAFLGVTTDETENGAKISEITPESAADKAGLKTGDIITKINEKIVTGPEVLSEIIRSFKPKEEVTIHYKRDGKENSSRAVLGQSIHSNAMSYSFSGPNKSYTFPPVPKMYGPGALPKIEMWDDKDMLNNETPFIRGDLFQRHQKLGLKIQDTEEGNGVKVLDVEEGSAARNAGLQKDDILIEIGGKKVMNTDEAREQLQDNNEKKSYPIKVNRANKEMTFDIKFPRKLKTANL